MAFGFIGLILLFLLVTGLVTGIVHWVRGSKGSASGEMSCGGCGYAVRGLEGLNCPECGADLRKVGITRAKAAGNRGLGIALTVVCGSLLLLIVGTLFMWVNDKPAPAHAPHLQTYPSPTLTPSPPAVNTPGAVGLDQANESDQAKDSSDETDR